MERRLAAVLAADMVGYSRLMAADEAGTLIRQNAHRKELIDPKIAEYGGRVVKSTGDGVLVEFPSVVDALSCAVTIQLAMPEREAASPEETRIAYRIGINLGDIIIEDDDIYGDGVNVAARLEALAEPGGIRVSRTVVDHVRGKVSSDFEDQGKQQVKNIPEPVHVFGVLMQPEAAGNVAAETSRKVWWWRPAAGVAVAVLAIAAIGLMVWQPWVPDVQPASAPGVTAPAADRPSIAVLPFDNISGDPEQEYFADGMTEDLITDLSKISDLTVISRTSTSGYKGGKIDIRKVGEALNVRYVIEGSVRKAGEQVRINAQLIDATTGGHLWAERYDGDLNDIFGLQDQVLEQIVGSLALKLSGEERRRLADKGTDSIAAHDLYLRGLFQESAFTRKGYQEARRFYDQALAIDPGYAMAYARIANILELSARNGWSNDVQADFAKALELSEKAVALDPQNPNLHWSLSRSISRLGTPEALERSIKSMERAIELDADFADAYAYLAVLYAGDGRAGDGLRSVETAMRLNPRFPFWYLFMRGMAHFCLKDYRLAIADFEVAAERNPTAQFVRWFLASTLTKAGQIEDAEWQVEELYLLGFEGNISTIVETQPIQDPECKERYTDGLRKAGIPE
jgi:TolB-like protein/class 3 adenylate cyclase/lipoprotein NlpI